MPPTTPREQSRVGLWLYVVVFAAMLLGSSAVIVQNVRALDETLSPNVVARYEGIRDLAKLVRQLLLARVEVAEVRAGKEFSAERLVELCNLARGNYANLTERAGISRLADNPEEAQTIARLDEALRRIHALTAGMVGDATAILSGAAIAELSSLLDAAEQASTALFSLEEQEQVASLESARSILRTTGVTLFALGLLVLLFGGSLFFLWQRSYRAIRVANDRFRLAMSALEGAIYDSDLKLGRVFWNEGLSEVFGHSAHSGAGRDAAWWEAHIHPEDWAEVDAAIKQAIKGREDFNLSYRFRAANGEYRHVADRGRVLAGPDGKPARIVGSIIDLTERKLSEQALEVTRQQLHTVVSFAPVVLFAMDAEGTFTLSEGSGLDPLGQASGAAVGQSVWEMYADVPAGLDLIRRALGGEAAAAVVAVRGLFYEVWCSPVRDAAGAVTGAIGVAVDVTGRERAVAALRDNERGLRRIVEGTGALLYSTDLQGRITYANEAGARLLDLEPAALVGRRYLRFIHAGDRARVHEAYRQQIEQSLPSISIEYRSAGTDRASHWLSVQTDLVMEGGRAVGLTSVGQDVTERRRTLETLRESERRFREILETVDLAAVALDTGGHIMVCNEYLLRLAGRREDEVLGCDWFAAFVAADAREAERREFEESVAAERFASHREGTIVAFNGEHRLVSWNRTDLRDHEGRLLGVASIGEDITERRRAERVQHVMLRIAQAANEVQDLRSLSRSIRDSLAEVIDVTNFDIALSDPQTGTITYPYIGEGDGRGTDFARVPIGRSLTAYVIRTGRALLADDETKRQLVARGEIERVGTPSKIWLGAPLITEQRVIGAVVLQSYTNPTVYTQRDLEMMEFVSGQIARAIERSLAKESLQAIVEGTSAVTGENFFRSLVRTLSLALRVRYAMVGELDGPGADMVRTLAVWASGEAAPNVHYSLAGSPCAEAIARTMCMHPHSVTKLFPRDTMLAEMRAESYIGVPLFDSLGTTIGILSVIHDEPMPETSDAATILTIFAARAGAELERLRMERRLSHQAFHDTLTGLPNRALFMERLTRAQTRFRRHVNPFAVLFLDLDRFKVINDSLGHSVGDDLIVQIGQRVGRCVRPEDTVARLGGDEFTVLIEDIAGIRDATIVAERILESIRQPFDLGGHEVFITASIGIALNLTIDEGSDDLLRDADVAMYRAKAHGRARFEVFDMSMHLQARELMRLEADLRRAFDRGEFRVYYQPKVFLETGRLEGLEALVRWEHPERGLLLPQEFIPLAEETGLIERIDRWVMETACRRARRWQDEFPADRQPVLSVNVSAREFQRGDPVALVADVLQQTGLEPQHLKIEITESIIMEDVEATVLKLGGLKKLGVMLEIDDFGTGYSSLRYLSAFPIDTLKIDRGFIRGVGSSDEQSAIVAAIITLAHNLGMRVTAEGVESEEQAAFLRSLNCEEGQGFIFAGPMDETRMGELLASDPKW